MNADDSHADTRPASETADESHAVSRILARAVTYYDDLRGLGVPESAARHAVTEGLAGKVGVDYITAAARLADALARRAARKLGGIDNGTT